MPGSPARPVLARWDGGASSARASQACQRSRPDQKVPHLFLRDSVLASRYSHLQLKSMSTLHIRLAHLKDTDALSRLINRAFIAESPWVSGERINPDGVRELIFKGVFL